ncbi:MAG TPA: hypothetical protein VD863_27625 [Bradyrhizobium sp.]|jgi:hypothetical protein|nr:hypothetical protein [Bradyrhizobium sp.]
MAFHRHGMFSFQVTVERMAGIGGRCFRARLTALHRHGLIGAAQPLEVPALRDYGKTAPQAEARVIQATRDWLTASPDTAEQPLPSAPGCAMPSGQ